MAVRIQQSTCRRFMKSLRSSYLALLSLLTPLLIAGCSHNPVNAECDRVLTLHFEIVEELNQSILPVPTSAEDPQWIQWLYQSAAAHRRAAERYASIQVSDPTLRTLQTQNSQYFQTAAQMAQDDAKYYENLKQNPTAVRDFRAMQDEKTALVETGSRQSRELFKYCDFESWINGSISIPSAHSRT